MSARKISFRFIIPFIAGLLFAAASWAAGKPFDQAGFGSLFKPQLHGVVMESPHFILGVSPR